MKKSSVVKIWIHCLLWTLVAAAVSPLARAWQSDGKALWADGTVKVNMRLGESPTYADGNTPNSAAKAGALKWNPYMKRVQLSVSSLAAGTGAEQDSANDVFFATAWQGAALPTNVLAMTVVRTSGSTRAEADIVVNSSLTWGSYAGAVQMTNDLGRVIAHETGHVLGLGHSDVGYSSPSLMYPYTTSVTTLQIDDVEGIANLYGSAPGFEPPVPVISSVSYDISAEVRSAFNLVVYTSSGSTYQYQWYKDGVAISGATQYLYSVSSAQMTDGGLYYVEVKGVSGTVKSRTITVTITPRRAPTVTLYSYSYASVYVSDSWTIYCDPAGSSPLSYQWQKDGVNISGATSSSYSIAHASLLDAGKYRVVVSNDVGSATSADFALEVKSVSLPVFSGQPSKVLQLVEGVSSSWSASITSPVALSYQWYKGGVLLATNNSSLSFSGLESEAGDYTMKATNVSGTLSFDFTVTISPKPQLARLELSSPYTSSTIGSSYYNSVSYYTNYSYDNTYQWYKDGQPLAGRTASSLSISSLKLSDAGEYSVVVKNSVGSVSSLGATLKVSPTTTTTSSPSVIRPVVYSGIAYLLQSSPAAVLRYDLANGKALSALSLPQAATQLCAGSSGVFASTSTGAIYRCALGSSTFALFTTLLSEPKALATLDDQLFWVRNSSYIGGIKISTKQLYADSYYSGYSQSIVLSISEALKLLVVTSWSGYSYSYCANYPISATGIGYSPSDIYSWKGVSWYLASSGKVLFDSDGYCYDLSNYSVLGALGIGVESSAVLSDGQNLVLSGGKAYLVNAAMVPVQFQAVPSGTIGLCASGNVCYSLQLDSQNAVVYTPLSLGSMQDLYSKSSSLDVSSTPVAADLSLVDKNDVLWMISRGQRVLAAWSPETKTQVNAITLRGNVSQAAYSAENHCIYLSYSDRSVSVVDLAQARITEQPFRLFTSDILAMQTAGPLVMVYLNLNYSTTLQAFDAKANLLTSASVSYMVSRNVWDSTRRMMFGFNLDTYSLSSVSLYSYNLSTTGVASNNPIYSSSDLRLVSPIRLGGGSLLVGSGQLIDPITKSVKAALPMAHVDAAYVDGVWVTIYNTMAGSTVKRWDSTLSTVVSSVNLPGHPVAMYAISGNRLLVLSNRYGAPRYSILDSNLSVQSTTALGQPSRLANISVQADAGQGMDALVPGFVINGTASKTLLLRGSGPGLAAFGVLNCLVDPTITLYNQGGVALAGNDNWGSLSNQRELSDRTSDLYAFPLAKDSRDAVLLVKLAPGAYSAQVQGTNNGVGRALVEVYDAEEVPGDARAVNMSARCKITKDSQAIGGFVIQGDTPKKLLIRAVGPGLIQYGVTGASVDPKLRVFSGSTVIAENNDWSADATKAAALQAAFASTGAFVLDVGSKDAALLVELKPGSYTVYMESADGGSGVGILEFYEVP